MSASNRRTLFIIFFVSGFSSLVYQVVWTRMAFASFGIITPVLSVVLSMFMLGLSVGSWAGGRFIGPVVGKSGYSAAIFYALAELMIGVGAFAVPRLFALGEHLLLGAGQMDSARYLVLSAVILAFSILPWCLFMGATFPLMMAYVRERDPENQESFSYLYLANVLGAMSGTILTAIVLVELLGFRHTLWIAAAGNGTIAAVSAWLGWNQRSPAQSRAAVSRADVEALAAARAPGLRARLIKWILFSTGFCAMAMEVAWTRAFTPVLKTQVYSFAFIVFAYLGATFVGSLTYRRDLKHKSRRTTPALLALLSIATFLPVIVNDPRLVKSNWMGPPDLLSGIVVLASICPLCAVLGYLTPGLIDEYALGRPAEAGKVYAINIVGCILGPLAASYLLLPWMSERHALVLLSLPFLFFFVISCHALTRWRRVISGGLVCATLAWSLFLSQDFEGYLLKRSAHAEIRRDYAASVLSFGQGLDKNLLVNGIGMTRLTPITKFMVHLPLAFHRGQPKSALVICFGMGTTFRSALSWDIDTTTVELVPGVTKAFGFYFNDARKWLADPRGRIVIDDGRRYLSRTAKKFDVIVIDPPPPVEAAGSSLLYSEEFYSLAKAHLKPNGILQAWFPGGQLLTFQAILRSLSNSFPYVRCFDSVSGWGIHMLASMEPIEHCTATELAARMPETARRDLMEWSSAPDAAAYLQVVLANEAPLERVLTAGPETRVTDDHPFNEYFLLRQWRLSAR